MGKKNDPVMEDRIRQIVPLQAGLKTNAVFKFEFEGIVESLVVGMALADTQFGQQVCGIAFHNDGFLICEQLGGQFVGYYDSTDMKEKEKLFKDKLGIDIYGRAADPTEEN